jgi:TRAP-type C4-dicarboxylate transport system permease small subunit
MQSSRIISKALKGMETALEWAVAGIIAIMVVNISLGIFFRYVLNNALFWTEEMSRYLMVWAGMLGAAIAMRDNEHVGVNFVIDVFPPAIKRVLMVVARLVISVFLFILLIKSFTYLDSLSIQKSAAMQIPMAIPYLSVTAGAIFMSIENLVLIARLIVKTEKPGTGE